MPFDCLNGCKVTRIITNQLDFIPDLFLVAWLSPWLKELAKKVCVGAYPLTHTFFANTHHSSLSK